MSGSPGSGGSNPRKFSEKIALHNQKQAEETRAFEQLMTDLTVSRVQFQKIQQLRLNQTRAQYYGGSLPNVNQIGNTSAEFQGVFPTGLDTVRGTRHHGLVERVHRDRNRINSPHRRPVDKHGRQISFTRPRVPRRERRGRARAAFRLASALLRPQRARCRKPLRGECVLRGPQCRSNVSLHCWCCSGLRNKGYSCCT
ncbi:hypothetical protein ANANG_G00106220 [Anguilla anguilla]|uniref:Transducer of regulated CREB activity N-terminal domain-containing protein n=1 Tax=Anguilla anguilla TaxID=7936 RepID=A0A9D3MJZ8_ANGAN|nr:hypothetical protein ANANG_G00106220 [Anguilla anguilla]